MLSVRLESGPLRLELGLLLFRYLNIILQTNTNVILFSIKNTIPTETSNQILQPPKN